jgi:hypothetical protein
MANGLDLRQYKWLGDNTAHRVIGQYQAVASWTSGAPTGGRLEALKGNSYSFELSAAGNAKILTATSLTLTGELSADQKSANLAAAKAVVDGSSTHAYVTIQFAADFNGTIGNATVTLSNPYYTIKTNNPSGLEWDNTTDTGNEHTAEYHTLDKISVEEVTHSANS